MSDPLDVNALAPLPRAEFLAWLRREGQARYHAAHPFHLRMHAGKLAAPDLQAWAINRYYYQTRIPIKDALILSKSEDPAFRRLWLRRIVDHDGAQPGEGGLELWLRLGEALGVKRERMLSQREVLPGVRAACDAYVELVRRAPLVQAVAASLTEFFAPDLMSQRIAAFERHYPFIDPAGLDYFRGRVPRAARDAEEAMAFVLEHADSLVAQQGCVAALVKKTEILWRILDCIEGREPPARAASS